MALEADDGEIPSPAVAEKLLVGVHWSEHPTTHPDFAKSPKGVDIDVSLMAYDANWEHQVTCDCE